MGLRVTWPKRFSVILTSPGSLLLLETKTTLSLQLKEVYFDKKKVNKQNLAKLICVPLSSLNIPTLKSCQVLSDLLISKR